MSKKVIKLVNDHGQEVAGIKTTSGDVVEVEFTLRTEDGFMDCLLPPVGLEYENGEYTFVFKDGHEQKYELKLILNCSVENLLTNGGQTHCCPR